MTLTIPNPTPNGTQADGQKVGQNFSAVASYVNTELLHADGSVAMTGDLLLAGDATAPNHAVRKGQLDALIPVGTIFPFGGATAPSGWQLCNGAAVSRTGFPQLFAALGTSYGGGNGTTTFNLPDLRGRVPVGLGSAPFASRGNTGGDKDASVVTHHHGMGHGHGNNISASQSSHDHGPTGSSVTHFIARMSSFAGAARRMLFSTVNGSQPSGTSEMAVQDLSVTGGRTPSITVSGGVTDHSGNTDPAGSSGTNKNLQPYVVVNYIIRMG